MAKKITFKEYVESKDKLIEALDKTPHRTAEYTVRKYCKLVVGESKEEKQYVPLKPKHKLFVEWFYEDRENPTPNKIKIDGAKDVDPDSNHEVFWEGERLLKWLMRNAHEESSQL